MMSTYDSACGDSPTASADGAKRKQSVAARIGALDREIGIWSRRSRRLESRPALQTRLIAVERERTEIDQETAATNADSPKPGANILARYKRFVVDLQVALTRDTIRARARL